MIDLHSHTTASDGQYSPEDLMALAHAAGIRCLAVTDHDTVSALDAAVQAGRSTGIDVVRGIEISAFVGEREVHVLGHFVHGKHPELVAQCEAMRGERTRRMETMIQKMAALGYPVTMEQVLSISQGVSLCRPHLARALVERGYVTSTKEAFDRWLGDGKPGHVERDKLPASRAIEMIRLDGGTATLAHPAPSRMGRAEIEGLAAAGLTGLEVFHPEHNPSIREKMAGIARDLDLIATAGSDFHGEKVHPGRTFGTASMDPAQFAKLRAKAA
jgi:predicted metal-dependent phosphoesterase TrpH